jgi:cell division protein FtsI/penicillin-binding protein 2
MAYNVIANQGTYVAPKLVQSTTDADGTVHPTTSGESRRVISETTADQLNVMLRSVVDEGTGQQAKIDGYHTFGKTGTAKKRQPSGKYTDENGYNQYQSTFIGVVPAEQPALSVYVMIDEPKGEYTGGTTAAPAFSKIASFALRRLGIPPAATDQARGGAPVQVEAASSVGVRIDTGTDRVQAVTVGSPEANPVPSTVPPAGVTTTTTAPTRPKG